MNQNAKIAFNFLPDFMRLGENKQELFYLQMSLLVSF